MTVLDLAIRALRPGRRSSAPRHQPGSAGERIMQGQYGTAGRAQQFYSKQVPTS